jgi:hypothetical protein
MLAMAEDYAAKAAAAEAEQPSLSAPSDVATGATSDTP